MTPNTHMLSNEKWRLRLLAVIAIFGTYTVWISWSPRQVVPWHQIEETATETQLPCRSLPGASETLVVLRTGATELQDRLPVHLTTTLRCYPNYILFSDHEEHFQDEHIFDALEAVDPEKLASHPDFELHRRLKQSGREALMAAELSGAESEAVQWHGKTENPGWKLDKWKFLPMVNQTFSEHPGFKWYVFVEADSYILWASLLQYLAVLDPNKPHYTGSQMYISDVVFAHGGSGFMVSRPAMQMVVDHYTNHKAELEAYTDGHWAGDCVLGKAFADAEVKFTDAWPIMQGDYPGTIPYARPDGRPIADPNKRVWCYPTVSYHHLSPEIVASLWRFEQEWIDSAHEDNTGFLRHKDVFNQYILPRMSGPRMNWDSESDFDEGVVADADECKTKCEAKPDCRQYAFWGNGHCKTRGDPRLGKAATNVTSGWLYERLIQFSQEMAPCGDEGWLT